MARPQRDEAMTNQSVILAGENDPGHAPPTIAVQLLHVPDCPLVDAIRDTLGRSVAKTGVQITVEDIEGPYPSPTLLIDGIDVTGHEPARGPSCRLDLPTEDDIVAALRASDGHDGTS